MWGHFLVVGLVGSALPFTMLAWGEERITSALTSVLNASTPLFTALFAALLLRDRLRSIQVVGLFVGIVGVGVAAGIGAGDLTGSSLAGGLAAVLAGACYGLSFTWSKRYLMAIPPMVAAAGQLTAATILLAPVRDHDHRHRRRRHHLAPDRGHRSCSAWSAPGVAYVLNFRIIADLGATRASLVTYLIPIVAVAVGIVVLDEPFGWRIVAGGGLIIAGVFLVNSSGGARRRGAIAVADRAPRRAAGRVRRRWRRRIGGRRLRPGPHRAARPPVPRARAARRARPGLPHRPADLRSAPAHPAGRRRRHEAARPARSRSGLLEEGRVLLQHDGLVGGRPRPARGAGRRRWWWSPRTPTSPTAPRSSPPRGSPSRPARRSTADALEAFAEDHAGKGPGGD